VIAHVGRIDAEKQVDLVVRAMAQVVRSTDAQLLIVGDGRRREEIIRLCEELGIRDHCRFPGFVAPGGDLSGLYRLSAVFVTASEVETLSSVVLEASASGLPVVAVQASSMPELVQDGTTGYLVAPGDVAAMADRIATLLRHPTQAKGMGHAGRAVAEQHALDKTIEAHERLYRSLASRHPRRANPPLRSRRDKRDTSR
jgi:glycosyltransferase involved in cell wall biosynthesis